MRKILSFLMITAVFSALALAESWTGKLIDANCYDQDSTAACAPSEATTAFALNVDGKVYKFDADGNAKAAEALRNRADRAEPGQEQPSEVSATVEGTESGETITVENIEVQ
jgi:hypothetical protein